MQGERKFNAAGPSIPSDHYMIDPLARLDLPATTQDGFNYPTVWYVGADHRLDMPKLLAASAK